jgi:hypothetical protein
MESTEVELAAAKQQLDEMQKALTAAEEKLHLSDRSRAE